MSNIETTENKVQVIDNKNHSLNLWEKDEFLSSVKKSYAKNLDDVEFTLFLEMGKALNLNPFLREIWAVKFGTTAAQIFIGRDGYRKAAQRHPDYEYHYCDAVYENDDFTGEEGIYHHKFTLKNRGRLVGAYCKVKRKSIERPFCVFVPIEEYEKGTNIWKTLRSTMIKKVSESHGLRMAFQDDFAGTYAEEEIWDERQKYDYDKEEKKKIEEEKKKLDAQKKEELEKNTIDVPLFKEKEESKKQTISTQIEDTPETRKAIWHHVTSYALNYKVNAQTQVELLQDISRDVLKKRPLIILLDECVKQTFEEHLNNIHENESDKNELL